MKLAKDTGCDLVKFQKRTPDICVPKWKRDYPVETPWGAMTYLEYKNRMEFWKLDYDMIDAYSKEIDMPWFASAWDIESLDFLSKYDCRHNKIASAMLTNKELVEAVAKQGKFTFISTGMSTIMDIDRAVYQFHKHNCRFMLMHCVSVYPCPDEELNLHMICQLLDRYKCLVGYSSHAMGVLDKPLAVSLGAGAVEFHISLDRTLWGTDQASSLERHGIEITRRNVDLVHKMLGTGLKTITLKEMENAKKQRYWL